MFLLLITLFLAGVGPAGAAVMVPLRPVLENRGITISWDGEAATGYCCGRLLRVVPGRDTAEVGGNEVLLDVPAVMLGGMTFVPDTLLAGFLDSPPPVVGFHAFTRVRIGEQLWLVGMLGESLEAEPEDFRIPSDLVPEEPDTIIPEAPGPARIWVLSGTGEDMVLEGLVSLMGAELSSGALGFTLAPGASGILRDALTQKLDSVTLPLERRIGSCLVNFNPGGGDYNNMLNAVQAAAYLNGITVPPGQVFSYNQTVGPRTAERGFVIGYAISGDRHVPARGGGVCRTSTVLYGAVLNAGLPVIERHAHTRPVGYVPMGRDATVSYGTADLKFRNDLPRPVRIEAGGTVRQLQVTLWELWG